jgi:hypothetical protein
MVSEEVSPVKQHFRTDDFFQAFHAISWLQSLTFGETVPLLDHNGRSRRSGSDALSLRRYVPAGQRQALADVPHSAAILQYVKFAVGTYGQASLKFLGVIPYGSATTNEQAAVLCAGIGSVQHIIRAQWSGGLYSPGYFLTVDEKDAKTIVLAIRGTLWPQDFLTDLICQSTKCTFLPSFLFLPSSRPSACSFVSSSFIVLPSSSFLPSFLDISPSFLPSFLL